MDNLELLEQYYFDRDIFCEEFRKVIPDIIDIFHTHGNQNILTMTDFIMIKHENEYYIMHNDSGTIINWYKNLGRINTCNKNLTLEEFRLFIKMLNEDLPK